MFSKAVPSWIRAVRYIFSVYPSFNFSKLFSDIAYRSADTINLAGGEIIKGTVTIYNIVVILTFVRDLIGIICMKVVLFINYLICQI